MLSSAALIYWYLVNKTERFGRFCWVGSQLKSHMQLQEEVDKKAKCPFKEVAGLYNAAINHRQSL